jgi:outer membrane immunogenic protein
MRRSAAVWLSATILMTGLVQTVSAADLAPVLKAPPPRTAYSWSGFYIGGFVGGAWGDKRWTEVVGPFPAASIRHDVSGILAGGQVGFNYQTGAWVFGVEGDIGWTDADGSTTCIVGPPFVCGAEVKSLATVTGRLGYAFDRVLLYGKGGGAWARDDYHASRFGVILSRASDSRSGWTAGVGIEYGLSPNWSVKLEYDYMDLGTDRVRFSDGAVEDIAQRLNTLKAGINYRF